MSFRQLLSLVRSHDPVVEAPAEDSWDGFERDQRALPVDYKMYISTFGSGVLADFFWIWNPFSRHASINWGIMKDQTLQSYSRIRSQVPEFFHQWKLYPERGGLLPCGHTMNGDSIFWRTDGLPEQWTIAVGREADLDVYCGNLCAFPRP